MFWNIRERFCRPEDNLIVKMLAIKLLISFIIVIFVLLIAGKANKN
jgi:uncharacterized membrane protein YidH (DUF202 family)